MKLIWVYFQDLHLLMFLHGVGPLAGVHATRGFGQKVLPESAGRTEVLAAGLATEDQK